MVQNFFAGRKDVLSVTFLEDVLFLSPPPLSHSPTLNLAHQEPRSHDPILRGQVTLTTHASRKARRIRVDLVGMAAVHGGDGSFSFSQLVTLEKSLEIDLKGELLAKGTHSFDFAFIIPSSTAVSERSVYGTVRHTVRATLQGAGGFRDLSSLPKPVWFIANPAAAGELPAGLEIDVSHSASELGPIRLLASSPHLTVASLLFLSITFENPPEGMKVMSVQAYIKQDFEIHSPNPDVPVTNAPTQRKLLFYADSSTPLPSSTDDLLDRSNLSRGAAPPLAYEPRALLPQPLARLTSGEAFSYARVTRIPDDDLVRPSTLEGTETPVRVKHNLVVQVRYRFKGSKKDQVLEMTSPVTIASCCCLTSSLLLPEYRSRHHPAACNPLSTPSSSRPSSGTSTPSSRSRSGSQSASDALSSAAGGVPIGIDSLNGQITPFHRRCLCNTSLFELVKSDGEKLAGAAAQSRSRSRAPNGSRSGEGSSRNRSESRMGSRLASATASPALTDGEDAVDSVFEDELVAGGGSGSGFDSPYSRRGRDVRRRKLGETYDVSPEPDHGIEELPPSFSGDEEESYFPSIVRSARDVSSRAGGGAGASTRGVSWAQQGSALRPARRQPSGLAVERGHREVQASFIVV